MDENSGYYLSTISQYGLTEGYLSSEDLQNIQNQLWLILGQKTERYTMGDSSSVPVEIAQELLKSICYCIGIYLKKQDNIDNAVSHLKTADMQKLFYLGLTEVEAKISIGKGFLDKVISGSIPIDNISYYDTLAEISSFFKKYDYRFFAHDIPCMIDYQLCHLLPDLQGIEYINEYLWRLNIENNFCSCFNTDIIISLLRAYCPDYRSQLINIYEPVAINAIGLSLLGRDVFTLNITTEDRVQLLEYFQEWSDNEAIEKLKNSVEELCHSLSIEDISIQQEYLQLTAKELYSRIKAIIHTNCLDDVFLSVYAEHDEHIPAIQYIDGDMMNDEALRNLIDEIKSCRYLSDKISIAKQQTHSIRDFIEVLNVCFWKDECIELFNSLSSSELAVLAHFVQRNDGDCSWNSASQWEVQLINYISSLEGQRKAEIEDILKGGK